MVATTWGRGRCATGIEWVEVRNAAQHPTMHRTVPNKELSGPNANSAEVEKPAGITQGYSDPRFRIKLKSLGPMQLNPTLDMQCSPALEPGGSATAKTQESKGPESRRRMEPSHFTGTTILCQLCLQPSVFQSEPLADSCIIFWP